MSYLKSLGAGTVALILYLVLVPAIKLWLISDYRDRYFSVSHFRLRSPVFLAFAGLVFVAVSYWEFRRLKLGK